MPAPAGRGTTRWLAALTVRSLTRFAIAIAASLVFAILAAAVHGGAIDQLDIAIALAVHRLDAAPADAALIAATTVGNNTVLLPAVALVAVLALRRGRRGIAIVLAIDAIAVIAACGALKLLLSRERPRLFDKIALPTDHSFPSGHAMSALAIYGAIAAALIALYPRARRPVIAAAVALIAAIGFSRVYLGVHWPFDVIGGYLAGVPPLVASASLIHRTRARA